MYPLAKLVILFGCAKDVRLNFATRPSILRRAGFRVKGGAMAIN
jgi:hypothetical protein